MKAIMLTQRGEQGVALVDTARPEPAPGWALVRMLAASVNRVDLYMRDSGVGITHTLPLIMGVDGVGEVVAAPPASGLAPGVRVACYPAEFCGECAGCLSGNQSLCRTLRIPGEHRHGTFAEFLAMPTRSLIPLPDGMAVEVAAALGVAALTAWRMVLGNGALGPGQTVLVQGAGGGVAHAAVQLARMVGARVIATTTGTAKLDHFAARGVETIDHARDDIVASVMAMTGGEGVDVVVDTVGERTWPASLRSLAKGGRLVTCGATTGAHPSADIQRLFVRQISVHGSTMGSLGDMRRLIRAAAQGHFQLAIDSVFPLTEVPAAFDRLGAPDRLGKILISIAKD
ncbi:zinc-binding alcohol dehydrogenase [Novosphingobium nitrogenifigens DSM 19370]|uniref:Zinc-binding alcohol dehydrogenase n=1 Tax=Novosphingobium nitrogenifigens DSM 19370 TaxID=983920 RepID=F1ZD14_9SPHN|nr:zinc-binding dehydrogenase [Novosphingobium nitrogenifigens]EGD57499.1 zinc-binding alcohol dehydrogenase [Novosphingobium nitrogenifigens DSM 19370]